ncbi:alanine racemase [Paeniglutamicibacter psychrophenolicus]|uniref:alanine racemase n=1 Tax=Paeniglutamicibacter psychrophenolicus TaxID=257454 RepID=UPI002780A81B|nr:alanine racemase [Paeniglutamicibacter psychrophenolicus]MDQ0092739.1 diaminopimelate decarboxylase [Paeniglutamicibacter psychrophenolicus]
MKPLMHGTVPLTARLEPWMETLLADPAGCRELIDTFGSPVNLHDFSALRRNADELRAAAAGHRVDFRVYLARKANKTIGAIDAAVAAGCGIDVAGFHELDQALRRGVDPDQLIVTAAVKSRELLALALDNGVVVSLDNRDEAEDLLEAAAARGVRARVALRLASANPLLPPTRFGLRADRWLAFLGGHHDTPELEIAGIHFHLNGYNAEHRALMLAESLRLVDALAGLGHAPGFIDMGGGIPMSYLDDPGQWTAFWEALAGQRAGSEDVTWKADSLGSVGTNPGTGVYPYHQEPVRGPWLDAVLAFRPAGAPETIAQLLVARNLQLRCEPGRSLLDGCGLTLAAVAFGKERSDGVPLLGLHMNRTQCRSTSADFLLDPILLHAARPRRAREPFSGFLVGAYCIEEELILRRRFEFPQGAAPGDVVAFPNTAGYLMHIVESASHQLPLAVNLVREGHGWVPDRIEDRVLRA